MKKYRVVVSTIYPSIYGYHPLSLCQSTIERLFKLGSEYVECKNLKLILRADIPRHDPLLLRAIEEFGNKINNVRIVEIDELQYYIESSESSTEEVITPNSIPWITIPE